ncbi:hypothetical protein JTB14_006448 [Gonioctena quinquepunctata]|nr:hypothetical protein JTB14_006448 [Gonioctena quinquepunctata]
MARKHKRLLGSRSYRNYSKEKLEEALGKVVDGTLSIREATRQFSIPFGTLYNRFKGIHGNNPGRPTIFTHDEELAILKSWKNLKNTLRGLPSSNIFNYDESNLSDDPGKKRGIYRRGVKYPEKVMNHSKSCTTIMVCGAADGTLLPPYVIYRSVHLYDSWRGMVQEDLHVVTSRVVAWAQDIIAP